MITTTPTHGTLSRNGIILRAGTEAFLYSPTTTSWKAGDFFNLAEILTVSSDGSRIAGIGGGAYRGIYTSSNSGKTMLAQNMDARWKAIASSADGIKLVAAKFGGNLYTSTDAGLSWSSRDNVRNWQGVASSADGLKLAAVVQNGEIYTSIDAGLTWTPHESARAWRAVASSADGVHLVAVVGDYKIVNNVPSGSTGQIYTSADGGDTWVARETNRYWWAVACSADGAKIVAADHGYTMGGLLYTSTDFGVTWAPRGNLQNWSSIVSSADGTQLAAIDGIKRLNLSVDSGVTWATYNLYSDPWSSLAMTPDGLSLVSTNGNRLQTRVRTTSDSAFDLVYTPALDQNGSPFDSFTFQVIDDGVGGTSFQNQDPNPKTFTFNVLPVTDTPKLLNPVPDQILAKHVAFNLLVADNTFVDPDGGPPLAYSASLADGSSLPAWLRFVPQSRNFSGTPGDAEVGSVTIKLTATKTTPTVLSAQTTFRLTVRNEAPSGQDRALVVLKNETHPISLADFGFADPNDLPANHFKRVKLTSLPAVGTLTVDGLPTTVGEMISVSTDVRPFWTPRESSRQWSGIVSSADGSLLVAVESSATFAGRIYRSEDGGTTWSTYGPQRSWLAVASSADGSRLAACAAYQVVNNEAQPTLYTSSDTGKTWISQAVYYDLSTIASSADGARLIASSSRNPLLISRDYGATWVVRGPLYGWISVASSADGMRLIAAPFEFGRLYFSKDGGDTWQITSQHGTGWRAVTSSADGTRLAALGSAGLIITSFDSGSNWEGRAGLKFSSAIQYSADGRILLTSEAAGRLYRSVDGGVTWNAQEKSRAWSGLAASADGSKLAATVTNGPIYLSQTGVPVLAFTPALNVLGTPYSSFTFQVEDDGIGGANLDATPNTITLNVTPPTPFQAWAIANGLPIDPNANGGVNLINFAFGLNANGSSTGEIRVTGGIISQLGGPTTSMTSTPNGVNFKAMFGRRKGAGLTYTVQFSADLMSWEDSTAAPTVIADDGVMEACTVPYPFFLSDGRKAQFFRVTVGS